MASKTAAMRGGGGIGMPRHRVAGRAAQGPEGGLWQHWQASGRRRCRREWAGSFRIGRSPCRDRRWPGLAAPAGLSNPTRRGQSIRAAKRRRQRWRLPGLSLPCTRASSESKPRSAPSQQAQLLASSRRKGAQPSASPAPPPAGRDG